jgi:hypothetical protein
MGFARLFRPTYAVANMGHPDGFRLVLLRKYIRHPYLAVSGGGSRGTFLNAYLSKLLWIS